MRNSKTRTLAVLFALVALALPLYAAAADQRPFQGAESGTFQLTGPCEGGVVVDVTGTGRATDVGSYLVHYRECLVPATGVVTGGSFSLTAADGGTISGTFSGQASPTGDPNVVAFDDPGVITGGTGRFAGLAGRLEQKGLANLATGEYTGTLTGGLSIPAAA